MNCKGATGMKTVAKVVFVVLGLLSVSACIIDRGHGGDRGWHEEHFR